VKLSLTRILGLVYNEPVRFRPLVVIEISKNPNP
jgi:hypothetical protein